MGDLTTKLQPKERTPDSRAVNQPSPGETPTKQAQRAATLAVNVLENRKEEARGGHDPVQSCTMACDMETVTSKTGQGGPSLSDPGASFTAPVRSREEEPRTDTNPAGLSTLVVPMLLRHVLGHHTPMWTTEWNPHNSDNERTRLHRDDATKSPFMVVRTGSPGKPTHESTTNTPGTHNIDLQLYMGKSQHNPPFYRLSDAAKHSKATEKTPMLDMVADVHKKFPKTYNSNLCAAIPKTRKKESTEHIILSPATRTASTAHDCSRYVTGTIASAGYALYVLARKWKMQRSTCSKIARYSY
jgi:hypothetical protein